MLNYAGEAGDAGDARLRWCWCGRATAANWLIDVIDDAWWWRRTIAGGGRGRATDN